MAARKANRPSRLLIEMLAAGVCTPSSVLSHAVMTNIGQRFLFNALGRRHDATVPT